MRRKLPENNPVDKTNDPPRRLAVFLFISNFLYHFGYQIWWTVFNNFAVEEIGTGPMDIGWINALREIPGLFGFLLGFLVIFVSEIKIITLSLILMGVLAILSLILLIRAAMSGEPGEDPLADLPPPSYQPAGGTDGGYLPLPGTNQ